jgi:hypothetical protein
MCGMCCLYLTFMFDVLKQLRVLPHVGCFSSPFTTALWTLALPVGICSLYVALAKVQEDIVAEEVLCVEARHSICFA